MKHRGNSQLIQIWSICIMCALSVSAVSAAIPSFVKNESGLYASNKAQVFKVSDENKISVVYLDNGLDAGLDIGMTALVYRGADSIGTVIFVETEQYQSAALILDLNPNQTIQVGDVVRLNTFRNS